LPGVGQIEALRDSAGKIESLRNHHLAGRAGKVEGNMVAEHTPIILHGVDGSWATGKRGCTPATDYLGKLLALLPVEARPSVQAAQLVAMNPYAVDVRYADDWREPQREHALRSLELAERIRTEARRLLPPDALT
jgi:hypothetical protein